VCTPGAVPVFPVRRKGWTRPKDSKASNTHHCAKGIGRSVQSFRFSVFIAGLASIIEADARHRHHGRWEYTLVGTCACSETSAFGAFDLAAVLSFHESGSAVHRLKSEAVRSGRVQHRGAQATKSSLVCPSVGNHTSAKHFLLKRCGLIRPLLVGTRKMLKGFTAPRSPLGAAALVPSPPWHFAGDVLAVEFWNDPDLSVDTLPTGIELIRDVQATLLRFSKTISSPRRTTSISILPDINVAGSASSSTRCGRDHE